MLVCLTVSTRYKPESQVVLGGVVFFILSLGILGRVLREVA